MTGRPEFKPNKAQRRDVEVWAAGGMSEVAIARVLNISRTTLRKHFGDELTVGGGKRKAEVLRAMFKAAKAGNVTAQKAFLARTDEKPAPQSPQPRTRPLGKKEVRHQDALTAGQGGEWGDDLAPLPGTSRLN